MEMQAHLALQRAREMGHRPMTTQGLDGFELDAYDPADPFSKPDSIAARCAVCEEILALDLGEKPYRFGRGWAYPCGLARAEAA